MLRNFFLLLAVSFLSLTVTAQQAVFQKGHEYCHARKMHHHMNLQLNKTTQQSLLHSFDVLNYSMELDLMGNYTSPYPNSFTANTIVEFRVDSALNSIVLNANDQSLAIDSVTIAGVSFTHENHLLNITLDRTYLPGEITQVRIFYRHNDINDNAIYADGGFLFTDCEPEGARKWFPCYDDPSDKATTDIKATVPLNVKLGSNGRLQDSIAGTNSITYHWISRDPVATYLVVLTSRVNYQLDIVNWTNPNTGEIVPFRFYFNQNEDPTPIKNIIGDMTSFFSEEFGDHPFEKNGFATLNNQFAWGGMENQTLTSLCPDCWSEWLIAHEFAHQWFGDMITCATWADIFLNEGFATWTEAHWTEETAGYDAYKAELEGNASYYHSANPNPSWPISDPDWAVNTPSNSVLFNYAITYMKSSCVLHQLRYVLGDSLFFLGMKAYATDTVNFRYKSATIEGFKNKMEEVTNVELDWFFDGWIYHANHPVYKNVYSIKPLQDGKWQLLFTARQQMASTYYWQMPLEIKINFMDLTDTIIRVFNSYNNQIFAFEFDKQPANLAFDPDNDILLKQGNTIVSVDETEESEEFSVKAQPSIFSDYCLVNYYLETASSVEIFLLDQMGRTVRHEKLSKQIRGNNQYIVKGESLASGIYFLVIDNGKENRRLKLIRK